MKTSKSIAKATVNLFEAVNCSFMFNRLSGAVNFCIYLLKSFERSFGYALHGFYKYLSKIYERAKWT